MALSEAAKPTQSGPPTVPVRLGAMHFEPEMTIFQRLLAVTDVTLEPAIGRYGVDARRGQPVKKLGVAAEMGVEHRTQEPLRKEGIICWRAEPGVVLCCRRTSGGRS